MRLRRGATTGRDSSAAPSRLVAQFPAPRQGAEPSLLLDDQLCFAPYAAQRAVTASYRPLLDELGLTYPQYLVLLVLWERGEIAAAKVALSDNGVVQEPKGARPGGADRNRLRSRRRGRQSSCFPNARVLVGRRSGIGLTAPTVAAKVGIGPNKQRGYGLAVALSVSLPVLDQDVAAKLVDAAHEVCPYSNATRGNIDVTILLG